MKKKMKLLLQLLDFKESFTLAASIKPTWSASFSKFLL